MNNMNYLEELLMSPYYKYKKEKFIEKYKNASEKLEVLIKMN